MNKDLFCGSLTATGCKDERLFLDVRADNERAIALYRKFGFQEIGTYNDYFNINGSFYDAKLMVLPF